MSALLGVVATVGVAGCPPSLDDPQRFQTTCPTGFSVDALLTSTCALSNCHTSGPLAAGGLDLAAAGAFGRMYGKTSLCGAPIISPAGASQSYLLSKLAGTAACGGRMPLGGTPLSAADVACVEAWITAGIAQAGPPVEDAGSDAASPADAGSDAPDVSDAAGDGPETSDGGLGDAGDAG